MTNASKAIRAETEHAIWSCLKPDSFIKKGSEYRKVVNGATLFVHFE
ncbi:MAG: hypothetical protein ABL949_15550 [Fimbriimonadaceae bacterium]